MRRSQERNSLIKAIAGTRGRGPAVEGGTGGGAGPRTGPAVPAATSGAPVSKRGYLNWAPGGPCPSAVAADSDTRALPVGGVGGRSRVIAPAIVAAAPGLTVVGPGSWSDRGPGGPGIVGARLAGDPGTWVDPCVRPREDHERVARDIQPDRRVENILTAGSKGPSLDGKAGLVGCRLECEQARPGRSGDRIRRRAVVAVGR